MMNDEQIKYMVNRFLTWRLPENFNPDAGISFKREYNENTPWPMKNEPVGTNLFDATQAEEMIRYLLEGLPAASDSGSGQAMGYQGDAEAFRQAMQQHREIAMKIGWCQGETFDEALERYVSERLASAPADAEKELRAKVNSLPQIRYVSSGDDTEPSGYYVPLDAVLALLSEGQPGEGTKE